MVRLSTGYNSESKIGSFTSLLLILFFLAGIPCITDCVMAEIEKLGQKYRVALRIAKDPRFERLCVYTKEPMQMTA